MDTKFINDLNDRKEYLVEGNADLWVIRNFLSSEELEELTKYASF